MGKKKVKAGRANRKEKAGNELISLRLSKLLIYEAEDKQKEKSLPPNREGKEKEGVPLVLIKLKKEQFVL